ncbi:DUF5131 family protein [Alicyclobacillus macrosporangiidus]|uniref:Protein gp37 n=1 Tax=Alicyclobacillus macrosporangiidus TaxID=392015 RepID=A0A1I7ICD5_9BACL|nr:phage Gp37/Gp68 family protein [Alicyclobacillus macrosporangiidus]SFU70632.1 protein gp37 [Alicyclobacillus macrosporangiidus]
MGNKSAIEWTDATWNPVTGCSKVSAGCTNCYAERLSHRFGWTTKPWNATYAAENVRLHPDRLEEPLKWKKPRRVFVNSMSDLFHEQVPLEFIAEVFNVMACATAACGKNHKHDEECWTGEPHTFQILTKRPERMMRVINEELPDYVGHYWPGDRPLCLALELNWPLPNVWLGVSAENQEAADERIPFLLKTQAAVRFVSCEPLLGPVNLRDIDLGTNGHGLRFQLDSLTGWSRGSDEQTGRHRVSRNDEFGRIDWVIVGGESGPNARPMHPEWARSLRDQCQAAGVAFLFKQWGEWAPVHELRCNEPGICGRQWYNFDPDTAVCRIGKRAAGRLLDGRTWDEYPERSV